jgi:TonB family protein
VIHFDIDERHVDENVVGSAISRREGVMLSIFFHAGLLALIMFAPRLPMFELSQEELEQRRARLDQRQDEADRRFVFVRPYVDTRTPEPRERADLSDQNRRSQAPQIAPEPRNPEPLARGNSPERVEAEMAERARGPESEMPPQPEPETEVAEALPRSETGFQRPETPPPAGSLGEALRNLQRYVQNETFDNPQGGTDRPGATIQFDTRGVEFGPWLRRFVSQVRRNWFVPQSAWLMSGHVVLQFYIHRNGAITDIVVVQPSAIESFNNAAYGAIAASNPTEPLPPEYPQEQALFTVTFYYNERPPD